MSRDPRKDRARKRRLGRREKARKRRRHNAFEWEAHLEFANDLPRCWTCGCHHSSSAEVCPVCGGAFCPPSDWYFANDEAPF